MTLTPESIERVMALLTELAQEPERVDDMRVFVGVDTEVRQEGDWVEHVSTGRKYMHISVEFH